jgi:hypothetical protein
MGLARRFSNAAMQDTGFFLWSKIDQNAAVQDLTVCRHRLIILRV